MESRPRDMEIALDGLTSGKMWTDDMPRDAAVRAIVRKVPADSTDAVRIYVVARRARMGRTSPSRSAQWTNSEADSSETRFETPETSE